METSQILETLAALTDVERRRWIQGALGVLGAMGLVLLLEGLYFRRSGRAGAWFTLRLVSAIVAPLTLVVVIVPARAVGGPEALGVFLLALFTAAPIMWFGTHLFLGPRMRPTISRVESVALGLSGLAIVAIPVTAFFAAEPLLMAAARHTAQAAGPTTSLPAHQVQAPRQYTMPVAGLVFAQSLIAAPDIRLVQVEQRQNGPWYDTKDVSNTLFCTDKHSLHLMWSALEPAPQLRLHWLDSAGARQKAEFVAGIPASGTVPAEFSIAFREDGFDPVAPIPRARTHVTLRRADGPPYIDTMGFAQPGEPRENNCLMPGYHRADWRTEGSLLGVAIRFYLPLGQAPRIAEFPRPGQSTGVTAPVARGR